MLIVQGLRAKRILDIGCNRGLVGYMLHGVAFETEVVEGVDFSKVALDLAQKVCMYDAVHCLDATRPFDLGRVFDLVLCLELLEHVSDPQQVIENVAKHAAPWALFSTPIELGETDGQVHVRCVPMDQLLEWLAPHFEIHRASAVESHFCEKPKWQGWNLVLGRKR